MKDIKLKSEFYSTVHIYFFQYIYENMEIIQEKWLKMYPLVLLLPINYG